MVIVSNPHSFESSLILQVSSRSVAAAEPTVHEDFRWSWKNRIRLITLLYINFCVATCFSLPAPFFPKEAEMKGASPTIYGLIFGVFQLVLMFSLFWGKLMVYTGSKFVLVSGIFVSSLCSILFGLLDNCPAGAAFIGLAFVVRIVEALGVSATYSAVYGLVPILFPKKVGYVISCMESAFGVGNIIGPTIGGFLFQGGGFPLPFIVMGSVMFTASIMAFFVIPDENEARETPSIKKMVSNWTFMMDMIVMAFCFVCIGFNEATLEPHIRQFNLQPYQLGLVFVVQGVAYASSSLVWGLAMDKGFDGLAAGLVGCLLSLVSFVFVGPAPFFTFGTYLSVVILSQLVLGVGLGAQLVCCYIHAMKNVLSRGFPDDVATHTLYSGVMVSISSIGSFIGPAAGGALLDFFGYRNASMFVVGTNIAIIVALFTFLFVTRRHAAKEEERRALLNNSYVQLD